MSSSQQAPSCLSCSTVSASCITKQSHVKRTVPAPPHHGVGQPSCHHPPCLLAGQSLASSVPQRPCRTCQDRCGQQCRCSEQAQQDTPQQDTAGHGLSTESTRTRITPGLSTTSSKWRRSHTSSWLSHQQPATDGEDWNSACLVQLIVRVPFHSGGEGGIASIMLVPLTVDGQCVLSPSVTCAHKKP
jgi:hypothetical protein